MLAQLGDADGEVSRSIFGGLVFAEVDAQTA